MSNLSAFKKKWIEKWCSDVNPFLRDGSMCTVTGVYHEEDPHLLSRKGTKCCFLDATPRKIDFSEVGKLTISGEQLCETKTSALPYVKLSYSHLSRRKLDRLVNGLPVIDPGPRENKDGGLSPIMLTQQYKPDNICKRQTSDKVSYNHCDIIDIKSSTPSSGKHRNAFAPNRSVTRARQKLLQKSSPNFKSRPLDTYTPIQNCWTSADQISW